jgi:hypothetical protein
MLLVDDYCAVRGCPPFGGWFTLSLTPVTRVSPWRKPASRASLSDIKTITSKLLNQSAGWIPVVAQIRRRDHDILTRWSAYTGTKNLFTSLWFKRVEGREGFTTWEEADEASRFLAGGLATQHR